MDLSGFAVFDFSEGIPYFSVTSNGVTFNRAVTLKLGTPAFVRLAFYKPKTNGVLSVRWNAQDLVATFKRLMESDLQHGFRVNGELVENGLMVFDLNTAKTLV